MQTQPSNIKRIVFTQVLHIITQYVYLDRICTLFCYPQKACAACN